jgi:ATP-dependent Lon protease
MNPVILLDEIEKSSGNVGLLSDVMATLLEILDPEQNATFVDHYIDHPIDLSNVMFICTANNLGGLSAALLDRVEVIRFTSYSDEEKEVIAKQYILPGVLEEYSLTPDQIQISDDIWISVIRPVGFDAGIRQLERNIATMIRSVARKIVEGESTPIIINKENLSDFLNVDQGPLS